MLNATAALAAAAAPVAQAKAGAASRRPRSPYAEPFDHAPRSRAQWKDETNKRGRRR